MTTPHPANATGNRRHFEHTHEIEGTPEAAFPLLCPVREYDWIDGWTCEMIYSISGKAEQDCVFTTVRSGIPTVWTCSHYEPPRRIDYVAIARDTGVMRLSIHLAPQGDRTIIRWQRTFTSLNDAGNDWLANQDPGTELRLAAQLQHYLRTGTMLRPAR